MICYCLGPGQGLSLEKGGSRLTCPIQIQNLDQNQEHPKDPSPRRWLESWSCSLIWSIFEMFGSPPWSGLGPGVGIGVSKDVCKVKQWKTVKNKYSCKFVTYVSLLASPTGINSRAFWLSKNLTCCEQYHLFCWRMFYSKMINTIQHEHNRSSFYSGSH